VDEHANETTTQSPHHDGAPADAVHAHLAAGATAADCPFLAQAGLGDLDLEMVAAVIAQVLGKSPEDAGATEPSNA
jgi:hypothetical protein